MNNPKPSQEGGFTAIFFLYCSQIYNIILKIMRFKRIMHSEGAKYEQRLNDQEQQATKNLTGEMFCSLEKHSYYNTNKRESGQYLSHALPAEVGPGFIGDPDEYLHTVTTS